MDLRTKINPLFQCLILSCLLAGITGQSEALAAGTDEFYPACIYAAQAAIAGNDMASARRWLEAAPPERRGWEWTYLNQQLDQSEGQLCHMPERIAEIRVSPDGARLAASCDDGTLAVFDLASGEQLAVLAGHEGPVYGLDWSPDGLLLASTSRDTTVRIWNAESYEQFGLLDSHETTPYSCTFSPDGGLLVTPTWRMESDGPVGHFKVWDTSTLAEIMAVDYTRHPLSSVAFTPDGKHCVVGCWEEQIGIFSVQDWQLERELVPEASESYKAIDDLRISPDGSLIATACRDRCARIYDFASGELQQVLGGFTDGVRSVGFDSSGTSLATASRDGSIRIWFPGSWDDPAQLLRGHGGGVECAVFTSPARAGAGPLLISSGSNGEVRSWDIEAMHLHQTEYQLGDAVYGLALHNGGRMFLVAGNGPQIRIVASGPQGDLPNFLDGGHDSISTDICYSPDYRRFITGSNDHEPIIWQHGEMQSRLQGHTGRTTVVDWSSTGDRVASASFDGTARIWDPDNLQTLQVLSLDGERGSMHCLEFSPDGSRLATGQRDGSLAIWDSLSGKLSCLAELERGMVQGVCWSPDGSRLAASTDDGSLLVLDGSGGELLMELLGHSDSLVAICWHPDGSRIFSCGYDYTFRVWDASDGSQVLIRSGLPAQGYAMDITDDGNQLAVGLVDGTVLMMYNSLLRDR